MKLKLQRLTSDDKVTIGIFLLDREDRCFTLEDAFHVAKIKGQTRIPAGEYEIKLRTDGGVHQKYLAHYGPDFHKGMLHLQDVPDYTWVYLHKGNDEGDTDGCPLMGEIVYLSDMKIGQSAVAYERIYPKIAASILAGEKVTIKIEDEGNIL